MGEMGDQSHRYNCLYFFTEADCHNKLCDQTPNALPNKQESWVWIFAYGVFFFFNLVPILPFAVVSWFAKLCSVMVLLFGVFYTVFVTLAQTLSWFSDLLMYIG